MALEVCLKLAGVRQGDSTQITRQAIATGDSVDAQQARFIIITSMVVVAYINIVVVIVDAIVVVVVYTEGEVLLLEKVSGCQQLLSGVQLR